MTSWKRKLVVITLLACIFTAAVANTTIAYFTDQESKTNTFTYGGGVEIQLTETNSDSIYTVTAAGQVIDQSPTVQNIGADGIYVAGILTLKSGTKYLSDKVSLEAENGKTAITDFLSGGAFADGQSDFLVKATTNGTDTFTVYVLYKQPLASNASVQLFEGIRIPNGWNTEDMQYMSDLAVTIDAYATQTVGFTTVEDAMKGAFGGGADSTNNHFAGYFS